MSMTTESARANGMGTLLSTGYPTYSVMFDDEKQTQGNIVYLSNVSDDKSKLYIKNCSWNNKEILSKAKGIFENRLFGMVQPGNGDIDFIVFSKIAPSLGKRNFTLVLQTLEGKEVMLGNTTLRASAGKAQNQYLCTVFGTYLKELQKKLQEKASTTPSSAPAVSQRNVTQNNSSKKEMCCIVQ